MSASNLRLSAAHLFYALFLSATATALFGVWGLPIAGFVALVWWQILSGAQREARTWARESTQATQPRSGKFKLELAVVLVISMLLLGLFLPATEESDPMRHAEFSMQVVAKAIAEYEQLHGQTLPAVVCDAQGRPMHSWRALILPYLGEDQLAADYRFDEPWDSPSNRRLAEVRPWHYRTYYPQGNQERGQTTLQLMSLGSRRIVVEHEQTGCNWLDPTSLTLAAWDDLNQVPDLEQGFWRRGFFMSKYRGRLAVSESRAAQLHPQGELSRFESELPEDGVSASWTRTELGAPIRQVHFDHALQLACFLVVALYPIRWLKRIQSIDSAAEDKLI